MKKDSNNATVQYLAYFKNTLTLIGEMDKATLYPELLTKTAPIKVRKNSLVCNAMDSEQFDFCKLRGYFEYYFFRNITVPAGVAPNPSRYSRPVIGLYVAKVPLSDCRIVERTTQVITTDVEIN